jgi:hypothetical protein
MTVRSFSWLALLLVAASACSSRARPTPDYSHIPPPEPRSTGEEEGPDPAEIARQQRLRAVDRAFIWKVDNGEAPSYLFGTIHVGVSLDSALPAEYLTHVDEARQILVEIDPSDVDAVELQTAARMRRGTSDALYPSIVWHDLVQDLGETVTGEQLKHQRPWLAMMLLLQTRVREAQGEAPVAPMDSTLVNYARQHELNLGTLETPRDQFNALGAVPDAEMAGAVARMVTNADETRADLNQLVEAYLTGDEAVMEALIFDPEEMTQTPTLFRELFDRRNRAWMRRLKRELDQGGLFVAVGLGHYLGERGLLAMLRAEGYPIERIQ